MNQYKKDFPLLNNKNIVYLDSGATTQKPRCVIDAEKNFYENTNANAYRGAYKLSVEATNAYNESRHTVAQFINAKFDEEIIFTKNATEALNLVAYSYGLDNLKSGDEVVLSIMEHHSNLVPWQKVTQKTGATLSYMYINNDYLLTKSEIDKKITPNTKIVSILSTSNVLGTINDIDYIIQKSHNVGAKVILDISQSIAHSPIDVQKLDADFVVFSGHKMYGPLGIGVLYGKKTLLNAMSPFLMGGDMIEYVYEKSTTFAPLPHKFEAGTQNVSGAYGLATAIKYIQTIGYDKINEYEKTIADYAYTKLSSLPYITLYCPKDQTKRSGVISFNINNLHPHDTATLLDYYGICVRAGNHCTQPLMRFLGIDSTIRISLAIYNSKEDIDKLIDALNLIYQKFEKYIKVNKNAWIWRYLYRPYNGTLYE